MVRYFFKHILTVKLSIQILWKEVDFRKVQLQNDLSSFPVSCWNSYLSKQSVLSIHRLNRWSLTGNGHKNLYTLNYFYLEHKCIPDDSSHASPRAVLCQALDCTDSNEHLEAVLTDSHMINFSKICESMIVAQFNKRVKKGTSGTFWLNLMGSLWIDKDLLEPYTVSEDPELTSRMRRPIWAFVGHTYPPDPFLHFQWLWSSHQELW